MAWLTERSIGERLEINGFLSANFTQRTRTTAIGSRAMRQVDPPIVRELRQVVAELQEEVAAHKRQIEELRGAVVALMEANMPRILRTPGGIMVLDKKMTADGRERRHTEILSEHFTPSP
jgi:hypothetical protein